MPFIYRNLAVSPHTEEENLPSLVASLIGLPATALTDFRIVRKGVDARRKPRIKLIYTVSFMSVENTELLSRISTIPGLEWLAERQADIFTPRSTDQRIVIHGSGPAGLFTALPLAEYGLT